MFTGSSFHSRGAAAPYAESPTHLFVMPWCSVGKQNNCFLGGCHTYIFQVVINVLIDIFAHARIYKIISVQRNDIAFLV